jgi:hypothetical protein
MTEFQNLLADIDACREARDWVGEQSLVESWRTCERPDWLLFFADKSGTVTPVMWRLLACVFARSSLQYTTDPRPLQAIEVAERFARGEVTEVELSAARSAAGNAAGSAARNAAEESAAESAESAAESAESAAGSAARNAWSAARNAAWSAARSAALNAAEESAWSAWSAANSAWSAARSAQCQIIREHLDLKVIYNGLMAQFPEHF